MLSMEMLHRVTAAEAGRTAENLLRKTMGFSRAAIRRLKRFSGLYVNGETAYLIHRLIEGDQLAIHLGPDPVSSIRPEPLPLEILFEDPHLLVVNKPPGMLTHPLKHEATGTIANAVLYHYRKNNLELNFRPVSRLDRNTSGLLVVAKHAHAGFQLAKQLSVRELRREYLAVVHGRINEPGGVIDLPIGPSPGSIMKHCVDPGGRRVVTVFRVEKYFTGKTLVRLRLETGRTHQIRVHLSHTGHPLVGDTLYGGRDEEIDRQALHCSLVKLKHPVSGAALCWEALLPEDMQALIHRAEK